MTTTACDDQYVTSRDDIIERLAMEVAPEEWAGMSTMHVGHYRITWGEYQLAREGLINKPSWDDAPEWAKCLCQIKNGDWVWWSVEPWCKNEFWYADGFPSTKHTGKGAIPAGHDWRQTLERRPKDKLTVEPPPLSRAEQEEFDASMRVFTEDAFPKQERYQDAKGEDWIDEFARTASLEEFRGAMLFTIGKYLRRAGKKDALVSEITKIEDYARRWREYELARELEP